MTRSIDRGPADLELILAADLDRQVAELCRQESDALGASLQRWGRFVHPVHVRTTEDRAVLRHAAGANTSALLCGLADLHSVTLLAPHRWSSPPAHHDLRDVLLHELAHVLFFQRCTPAGHQRHAIVPMWMREGMATYAAVGPPAPNLRRTVGSRSDLLRLVHADAATLAAHGDACYVVATLLFAGWLGRFGDRRLAALCRQMRTGADFARAHRLACGSEVDVFLKRWVNEVQAEGLTG